MSIHLTATPASLLFEDGLKKATFTLHNTGTADVHVTSMSVAGPNASWFHAKAPTNFIVHKNTTHAVEVDLSTSSHGPGHASLTVHSNAPNVVVSLTKEADYVPHGQSPNPGGTPEEPSTGPNTNDPSGTGWGADGGDGSGGCFVAGTRVLMADGSARRIEELAIGDAILAIPERDHASQDAPAPQPARIEDVFRHDDRAYDLLDVGGIRATAVHRWGVREGGDEAGFLRTDRLVPGSTALRVYDGVAAGWQPAPELAPAGSAEIVYNCKTSARTYLVGSPAGGPWYVVHNAKKKDDDEPQPPGNP